MYPSVPNSVATGLHMLLGYVTVQTAHCALSKQYGGTINVKLGTLYQQNENPDLVSAAGKTMSYCGQQRLAIRVPLVRLYQVNVAFMKDIGGGLLYFRKLCQTMASGGGDVPTEGNPRHSLDS